MGARLALAAARPGASPLTLSAVARGATAEALRAHGLRLQSGGESSSAPLRVATDAAELGRQDLVILAVKQPSLADAVDHLGPLLGPDTVVITAMNGVPWWFFQGFGGEYADMALPVVDPGGKAARTVPAKHIVGCVVHLSSQTPEPGLVRLHLGNRLIFGEPAGGLSERVGRIAALFQDAGFDVESSACIQRDIWYKLWGNMTMNPVSALTGETVDRILDDPLANGFCVQVMAEAARIGQRIGCPIEQTGEERNAVTRKLGAMKTSMLQDLEAGRRLEIDALLTVVREIGQKVGEPTPFMDALLGLARLQATRRGLYP